MIFALFGARKGPARRAFDAPNGVTWGVEARSPGPSNVMIVFVHPDPNTTAYNRYAWWVLDTPAARDVTARLDPAQVLANLTDADLAALFKKSMPISSQIPRFEPA